jgi:malyl-CoA/(S)-citramalyl-CoA lyase
MLGIVQSTCRIIGEIDMSHTTVGSAYPRPQRSQLAVPASNPRFIEKARSLPADVIFLDLEDAVAPNNKVAARRNVIEALNDLDWGQKTLQVRINGLDTEYMYRDVVEIVEACPRLDMLLIPKVGVPADVYALDMLVSQIEMAKARTKRIGFDVLIETALGMTNVEAIAASSARLEAISFGVGDYGASTRARSTAVGGTSSDYAVLMAGNRSADRSLYYGDQWHYAQSRVLVACRAYGLRPIDGPFGDIADPEGYQVAARRACALGFEGKWAIHPTQIEIANSAFSPEPQEIESAKRILVAMDEAQKAGRGAVALDGKLVDIANIKMAENVMQKARQLGMLDE